MKRWMLVVVVSLTVLATGWRVTLACDDDPANAASAQTGGQILQVDGNSAGGCMHDAATVHEGGCMPGGGCCGGCMEKGNAADKSGAAQDASGGCPCMHDKHKPAS